MTLDHEELKRRLWEALRFAASRSVISSAEEQAILSAFATAPSGQAPLEGVVSDNLREDAKIALMYLDTGFMACDVCGHEMPTNTLDATYTLRDALAALLPASAEPAWWLVVNQHGEAVSAHKVKEAALGHESGLWSGDELVPLYASPPASGAVEAGTPGAQEAFVALDVADRIIERAFGTEVPGDWHEAYRAVAKARSRKTRRRIPAAPTEGR